MHSAQTHQMEAESGKAYLPACLLDSVPVSFARVRDTLSAFFPVSVQQRIVFELFQDGAFLPLRPTDTKQTNHPFLLVRASDSSEVGFDFVIRSLDFAVESQCRIGTRLSHFRCALFSQWQREFRSQSSLSDGDIMASALLLSSNQFASSQHCIFKIGRLLSSICTITWLPSDWFFSGDETADNYKGPLQVGRSVAIGSGKLPAFTQLVPSIAETDVTLIFSGRECRAVCSRLSVSADRAFALAALRALANWLVREELRHQLLASDCLKDLSTAGYDGNRSLDFLVELCFFVLLLAFEGDGSDRGGDGFSSQDSGQMPLSAALAVDAFMRNHALQLLRGKSSGVRISKELILRIFSEIAVAIQPTASMSR